jgi:hypothetical protein
MDILRNTITNSGELITTGRSSGSKFRYIIHGIPKQGKYTIEEAEWCDRTNQFITEQTYVLSSNLLRQWLGYSPFSIGEIKVTMWIFLPHVVYSGSKSPLKLWLKNRYIFAPYCLDRLRFFPQSSDVVIQASQIPLVRCA